MTYTVCKRCGAVLAFVIDNDPVRSTQYLPYCEHCRESYEDGRESTARDKCDSWYGGDNRKGV